MRRRKKNIHTALIRIVSRIDQSKEVRPEEKKIIHLGMVAFRGLKTLTLNLVWGGCTGRVAQQVSRTLTYAPIYSSLENNNKIPKYPIKAVGCTRLCTASACTGLVGCWWGGKKIIWIEGELHIKRTAFRASPWSSSSSSSWLLLLLWRLVFYLKRLN